MDRPKRHGPHHWVNGQPVHRDLARQLEDRGVSVRDFIKPKERR